MRRFSLVAFVSGLLGPAVALAQPGPPPPTAPAPLPAPAPAPRPEPDLAPPAEPTTAPAPVPQPQAQPQPQPPPPPPGQPYYQPVQPVYAQPPAPVSLHNGMTVELNLGLGWIRISDDSNSNTSDLGVGGLSGGVGGWVNPHVAITGRLGGVTVGVPGGRVSNIFLGPAVQYWVDDHFWLGGGLGLGIYALSPDSGSDRSLTGIGVDLRVGYTFNEGTEHTFNASLEINPGHFSDNGASGTATGIGILLGYQHL